MANDFSNGTREVSTQMTCNQSSDFAGVYKNESYERNENIMTEL